MEEKKNEKEQPVPHDTVLEVQDGELDSKTLFGRIDRFIENKIKEANNGQHKMGK